MSRSPSTAYLRYTEGESVGVVKTEGQSEQGSSPGGSRGRGRGQQSTSPTEGGPGIPIATFVTANENWRGKNDPAERRRIQNRLNQRAFRQRQRAGESPKRYRPRRSQSGPASRPQAMPDSGGGSESPQPESSRTGEIRSMSEDVSAGRNVSNTENVWDELGHLINRNFMGAAVTNAQHLGIDLSALTSGALTVTPSIADRPIPATLVPVDLQYTVPHDPIVDTIPHARLRYNILSGVATGQVDASALYKCLRASGALEDLNGTQSRGGVVVWSSAEQVASWELSEPFIRRWKPLLQGCEDLIAATNVWRDKRFERLFSLDLEDV